MKEDNDKFIDDLTKKINGFKELEYENIENLSKLSKLYELGVVKEDGKYNNKDQCDNTAKAEWAFEI